jgi:hypothetical protein
MTYSTDQNYCEYFPKNIVVSVQHSVYGVDTAKSNPSSYRIVSLFLYYFLQKS